MRGSYLAFLIYPYWNVNMLFFTLSFAFCAFLIYPYWNVNKYKTLSNHVFNDVSNLSILECKFIVW